MQDEQKKVADLQSKGDGGDGAVAEVEAPEAAWEFRGVDPADKTRPRLAQDSPKTRPSGICLNMNLLEILVSMIFNGTLTFPISGVSQPGRLCSISVRR